MARPLAAALEPVVKQPVVIETKAGAAGQVGAQVAAMAKPDGYTLLSHITSISGFAEVDKLFGRTPKCHPCRLHSAGTLHRRPVRPARQRSATLQDGEELIDAAKKNPEAIIYSSGGLYGASHLPMAMLEKAAGLRRCAICRPMAAARRSLAMLGNNAQC